MDPLAPIISALHAEGRLRVWSLVITVFGDMVQHRGGVISTARLGALLGRVGVEPGALRTALSRLGRDGWVSAERQGRTSLYRLTPQGLDSFAPATALIYAPPRPSPVTRWALVLRLNGAAPQVGLVPADQVPPGADCVVAGDLVTLSDAYRASLLGEDLRAALAALAADLAVLERAALDEPLDAAAARLLLIHRWRRIVLRHSEPLPELMPKDAPLAWPRAAVARTYLRIAPRAEAWLDAPMDDPAPMAAPDPAPDPALARRFR
ncbi:MAG: phenylacetic acid degradation operon negative regulatory protein PaaX [Rhodobacteraceae bacterium]|nr:MAG: phenylacetic acid degradation operon negative regulatory protein PaaX [Paracoccaceae bacterium]